jgi:hypothetical protein
MQGIILSMSISISKDNLARRISISISKDNLARRNLNGNKLCFFNFTSEIIQHF